MVGGGKPRICSVRLFHSNLINLFFSTLPIIVFQLLETLYNAFDDISKRRRVFKVETIGDCVSHDFFVWLFEQFMCLW